jgi:hypothetical protein
MYTHIHIYKHTEKKINFFFASNKQPNFFLFIIFIIF